MHVHRWFTARIAAVLATAFLFGATIDAAYADGGRYQQRSAAPASQARRPGMVKKLVIAGAVGASLLIGGGKFIGTGNELVRQQEMVNEASSAIDVVLKQRSATIGNLVKIAERYATHERDTHIGVALGRAGAAMKQVTAAQGQGVEAKLAADRQLVAAITPLITTEAPPNLKADAQFTNLAETLKQTEDRLRNVRDDYNGAARHFNTYQQTWVFPAVVSGIKGVKLVPYIKADEAQRADPVIEFGK